MPTLQETTRAIYGAWRLAHLDGDGMRWFDASLAGFWRSFFAFVIVAPGYAALKVLDHLVVSVPAGGMRILLVDGIAYVVGCFAYPLVMVYLCDAMDRRERYLRFIVALNWSTVLQMAVFLPAAYLGTMNLLPGFSGAVFYLAFVAVLAYQWFITRTALEVPGLMALGAVAVDLSISYAIGGVAMFMLRTPVVAG